MAVALEVSGTVTSVLVGFCDDFADCKPDEVDGTVGETEVLGGVGLTSTVVEDILVVELKCPSDLVEIAFVELASATVVFELPSAMEVFRLRIGSFAGFKGCSGDSSGASVVFDLVDSVAGEGTAFVVFLATANSRVLLAASNAIAVCATMESIVDL